MTAAPLSIKYVLQEAREGQRFHAQNNAPYTAGMLGDCIAAIEQLQAAALPLPEATGRETKDEMLAFFLAFFEGWEPETKLTLTNMEALERARVTVAALSKASPVSSTVRGTP